MSESIELEWIAAVDRAAKTLLGRDDRQGAALAHEVALLSEIYTRDRTSLHRSSVELAARLRFFFLRDLPKIQRPLRELGRPKKSVLRVLDLGAGLGASSIGISRVAKKFDLADRLDVIAVEKVPRLVDVMRHLASRVGTGDLANVSVPISLVTRELDLERLDPRAFEGKFDLIVVGFALNELFVDEDTVERRADWLTKMSTLLEADGAMLVLEPALRTTTRELMAVRDHLVEHSKLHVLAPCTANGSCPLLRRERDWCHADDDFVLPESLAEIARNAGLRWEGASYAYLTLAAHSREHSERHHRVVGGPIESKGRTEWHLCHAPDLVRFTVLHRHEDELERLSSLRRGDVVALEPRTPPLPRGDANLRADRDAILHIAGFPYKASR